MQRSQHRIIYKVFRRIGGLETKPVPAYVVANVFRRIGGLEKQATTGQISALVFRRIGGLEICGYLLSRK